MRPHVLALALSFALAALVPASARAADPAAEDSLGGTRVFLTTFSVQTPAGQWKTSLDIPNDVVDFEQEKLGAVRLLTGHAQGSSDIKVYGAHVLLGAWALTEDGVAADWFDAEERTMRTEGEARGLYRIKEIARDTLWLEGRRLHVMRYVIQMNVMRSGQGRIDAALYLWFPPDHRLTHRFYGFHVSEATRGFARPVVERIQPVIRSFRLERPEPLDDPAHALLLASALGDTARVVALVRAGGDVNTGTNHGTPLVLAAAGRRAATVDWLLAHGADPRLGSRPALMTPLMAAAAAADRPITLALLEHGAAPDQRSADSTTALQLAAVSPDPGVVRLLVERGAAVDAGDDAGLTPLMLAARQGRDSTVAYLLEKGAAVNGASRLGWTALQLACEGPHPRVVALLLSKGADPNLNTRNGWSALMTAARKQDLESVRALIRAGADVNARNVTGVTPMRLAKEGASKEIRAALKEAGAK